MLGYVRMTAALAWALRYVAEGFPVFPVWPMRGNVCRCRSESNPPPKCHPGKHPLLKRGLNDASLDPAQVNAWFGIGEELNVGIAVPDGILVYDADPRNGGGESHGRLLDRLGSTRAVATGGGGLHLYYRVPPGLQFPGSLVKQGFPGIDLKQLGGYVLAPPSNHESGGVYTLLDDTSISSAPSWLVDLGKPRNERGSYNPAATYTDDLTPGFDHAPAVKLLAPYFVAGCRHKFAFALGGYMKNRGYTTADAEAFAGRLAEAAGSADPDARAADAARAWRYEVPAGFSRLMEWVPPSTLDQLSKVVPDRLYEARKADAALIKSAAITYDDVLRAEQTLREMTAPPTFGATQIPEFQYQIPVMPPGLAPATTEPSIFLETIGRAELDRLTKSLSSNKRTDEDRIRGRALKKLLSGTSIGDDQVQTDRIVFDLARDIAKQYPHAAYDPTLLAGGLHRNSINEQAFIATLLEQQAKSREILDRNKATTERRRAAGLSIGEDGAPRNSIGNVVAIMVSDAAWEGVLRFDVLNMRVVICKDPPIQIDGGLGGAWKDTYTTRARVWIEHNYDFSPAKENVDAAVDEIAHRFEFNPVQDYLESLVWDGKPRLDGLWVDYFGAYEDPWHRITAAKFLLGAVSRALPSPDGEPSKVDTMPVLEGPQGIKKSSALDALFGGTRWFSDSYLPIGSLDAIQQLDGVWCQEFADLHSLTTANINLIKAFLTSRSDNIRRSYARRAEKEGRRCVFVGTTNDTTYLRDQTGGRRFWPIKCGIIDIDAIRRDRDQLWAEAVVRFRAGEKHWFDTLEDNDIARTQQAERTETDPWEEIIDAQAIRAGKNSFTIPELMALLEIDAAKQDKQIVTRLGQIMKKLGYERRRQGGGSRSYHYIKSV